VNETKVQDEGSWSIVQASASGGQASGNAWSTASAPPSAVNWAYVDGFTFSSARQIATQHNRGVPTHHKVTRKDPIQLTVNLRWTGAFMGIVTASGATMPLVHGEFRANDADDNSTGAYYQFHSMALQSMQFAENQEGDTLALTYVCLGMNGPTASGYLS